jgi:hypothetical protein
VPQTSHSAGEQVSGVSADASRLPRRQRIGASDLAVTTRRLRRRNAAENITEEPCGRPVVRIGGRSGPRRA